MDLRRLRTWRRRVWDFVERRRLAWSELTPWVSAALVALTVSWAADGLKETFEAFLKKEAVQGWMMIAGAASIVVFVAAVAWLYRLRNRFFQPRTRFLRNETPEKREHLVLFLSNLDPRRGPLQNGVPAGIELTGDFEQDLETLVTWKRDHPYWPWEMPLRGIRHHLGRLQTITVICSPQSIRQVHWFGDILQRYPPLQNVAVRVLLRRGIEPRILEDCPKESITEGGWDFERFDDLSRAILYFLRGFRRQRVSDDQIMIDFTGGQKVTGMVAAAVTFNRTLKAQYVQTNEPYAVISYDILMGSLETGGVGM
ncbi:MAG TPA: hypothetical protein VNP04_07335 [Alphaproteobacteria bacterium]|nr:hypothetical protein [Alphaproteobacteria bacterium]